MTVFPEIVSFRMSSRSSQLKDACPRGLLVVLHEDGGPALRTPVPGIALQDQDQASSYDLDLPDGEDSNAVLVRGVVPHNLRGWPSRRDFCRGYDRIPS